MAGGYRTCTFYANGGAFSNNVEYVTAESGSSSMTISDCLGENIPTKQGYIFSGWSETATGSAQYTMSTKWVEIDDSIYNFYAVWKSATPTITFDANSGTFPTSGESQTTYNSTELTGSTALSSIVETPTKPGYVFQGWSTTSTGSVQYTQASMPTISSDTTLYAIYEPDTTKVLLEKGAVDIILGKLK